MRLIPLKIFSTLVLFLDFGLLGLSSAEESVNNTLSEESLIENGIIPENRGFNDNNYVISKSWLNFSKEVPEDNYKLNNEFNNAANPETVSAKSPYSLDTSLLSKPFNSTLQDPDESVWLSLLKNLIQFSFKISKSKLFSQQFNPPTPVHQQPNLVKHVPEPPYKWIGYPWNQIFSFARSSSLGIPNYIVAYPVREKLGAKESSSEGSPPITKQQEGQESTQSLNSGSNFFQKLWDVIKALIKTVLFFER